MEGQHASTGLGGGWEQCGTGRLGEGLASSTGTLHARLSRAVTVLRQASGWRASLYVLVKCIYYGRIFCYFGDVRQWLVTLVTPKAALHLFMFLPFLVLLHVCSSGLGDINNWQP